jgi:2-polyprenyl-3-methyl-5-hydroxy-6-metoxy-1,4-benzoquinol methylase
VQAVDFSHIDEDYYAAEDYQYCDDMEAERKRQWGWNCRRIDKIKKLVSDIAAMKALDFGCGTGGFLQQAQGVFGGIIGFDLNEKVCSSHVANGWKCVNSIEAVSTDIEIIFLFHVLEHIAEPWGLLTYLQSRFVKAGTFVIEVPNTNEALNTIFENVSYRRNHFSSEHIWYFTPETLRQVVEKGGLEIIEDTQLQRYTLANTLGWLSMNKGGAQDTWGFFNEKKLNELYEDVLVSEKIADSVFFICGSKNQE